MESLRPETRNRSDLFAMGTKLPPGASRALILFILDLYEAYGKIAEADNWAFFRNRLLMLYPAIRDNRKFSESDRRHWKECVRTIGVSAPLWLKFKDRDQAREDLRRLLEP